MGDVFNEQIIKKEPTTKTMLLKIGIIFLSIIIVFISTMIPIIQNLFLLVVLGVGFGAYTLISRLNIEYEYIFTNGELDVDCIYNRAKRKRVFSCDIKSCEVFVSIQNGNSESYFNEYKNILDFSSGKVNENTYAFAISNNGKNSKVIIEPNDKMLKAFIPYLGQRKFIRS